MCGTDVAASAAHRHGGHVGRSSSPSCSRYRLRRGAPGYEPRGRTSPNVLVLPSAGPLLRDWGTGTCRANYKLVHESEPYLSLPSIGLSTSGVGASVCRLVPACDASVSPLLRACFLFPLEVRELTHTLSLSSLEHGHELHSELCPHIMVCMDVRSKLPNHWVS